MLRSTVGVLVLATAWTAVARERIEVSSDGQETVRLKDASAAPVGTARTGVPYGTVPDWSNTLRRQCGGLAVADLNGDGWNDVVVGCYISNSYPPYTDWENLIYYNTGGQLEASPSWVSTDEVSTGDVQVADINGDGYPDIFAANGGSSMSPCVIYFGSPTGPSPAPGWTSNIPARCWTNYALPFDFDHDGDPDVLICGQGNSSSDPYRPMFLFRNHNGTLETVPSWQSAETSIQNFLAAADYDGDGWEDVAVSKWANFQSGVYRNLAGTLATTPAWTVGNTDTDKGVGWADVNGDGWPDLALGHSPTRLYTNAGGTLTLTWNAVAPYFGHSDLRFCDVDRDGDPDLAEIHFSNGKAQLYVNTGGALDPVPAWSYDSPDVGTALAFGDINGDRRPDLVLGFSGVPSVVVFYARPPAVVPGDLNCDGARNFDDIDPFVLALSGYDAYDAEYPACNWLNADANGDGAVNFDDIDAFVALIGT